MTSIFRSRFRFSRLAATAFIPIVALAALGHAQESSSFTDSPGQDRILLVLPFDNLTDPGAQSSVPLATPNPQPADSAKDAAKPAATSLDAANHDAANHDSANLDWLREAAPEILNSRFTSAGFFPLTREDRLYALDHLGLPETFQPSRATALRIAQTLDANFILIGSYRADSATLTLRARVIDVAKLRLSSEVVESGPIAQLIPLLNSLAWQLTRKLDPSFSVAEETFRAADPKLRLDAFEQYIRGITEPGADERLRHLKKATELNPDFTAAWFATGKLQFAAQLYEQAAVSFSKVDRNAGSPDPASLEAAYYRGLSLIFSGNYPRAEDAFAAVARVLPLPEVVNNQAVAISRRGRDAIALFRQAAAADPTDPDYRFNLAVSLHRHGNTPEALTELAESLKLNPTDSEAKSLEDAWKSAASPADSDALERIKRTYDGVAFRQASLMLDQVEATRLAALPGPQRAAKLSASAREKLDRGLLLEAERGYQAAIDADDQSAQAHAGLAQVRERAGDPEAARKEALAALVRQPERQPGAQTAQADLQADFDAYLVLARLDLAADHLREARDEADQAAKIEPNSRPVKDLRRSIDARPESLPAATSQTAPKP